MPNLLPLAAQINEDRSLGLSFSQVKKSARRMEKRCDGWAQIDAERYVLDYWDPTGEHAAQNIDYGRKAR